MFDLFYFKQSNLVEYFAIGILAGLLEIGQNQPENPISAHICQNVYLMDAILELEKNVSRQQEEKLKHLLESYFE